ncbi:hypothetical protein OPW41_13160 [Vibrio europaeus]|uniref:hypothetical protein n=1 Tax=Vibrio europaeus TaxID=300876 RepID=UPI00233F2817|nr:hypothetical protein [Vibrio europaeus]MDC5754727.1 hypothetical protein [Vibrio europaeus]MDC5776671.1 hypothetical protein [Vibrio europaeus]MDC5795780.1 hypothetical protein [Vibrio europaeus]MDC5798409.1 hypothetical protein [Vibrio europaeus]MDC5816469.1 hypothetical protein [Vibrio europaeus]
MLKDNDYEIEAIKLLDRHLVGVTFPVSSNIQKDQLVQMYLESRDIYRLNVENFRLFRCAESLWSTCIRVVRCSGTVGEEAKVLLINGKQYSPEAESLYEHSLNLYKEFLELQ